MKWDSNPVNHKMAAGATWERTEGLYWSHSPSLLSSCLLPPGEERGGAAASTHNYNFPHRVLIGWITFGFSVPMVAFFPHSAGVHSCCPLLLSTTPRRSKLRGVVFVASSPLLGTLRFTQRLRNWFALLYSPELGRQLLHCILCWRTSLAAFCEVGAKVKHPQPGVHLEPI